MLKNVSNMNFIEYIKHLAEKHVDVRHDDGGEVHFLSSEDEKNTAMSDMLCYPAVIVDKGSGFSFTGEDGAFFKQSEYSIFVLQHVDDTSDYAQISKAFNHTEKILCEILNKILEDKKKTEFRCLKGFRLEEVDVDYISNSDMCQYGVIALVTIDESYKALNCRKSFHE